MDDCLAYAAEHRPELMQAKYGVDAAKGALMVARSGHMPQVSASATQQWSDSNWPGDENGKWGVGVSVSMNVFDTGVTLSKIHGAEADLKKAEETYRDTVNAVNLDVRSNYLGLREAEKRISTTKLAVEQADEDYRIAQLRYMSGVGTNTDVLDAQVALTKLRPTIRRLCMITTPPSRFGNLYRRTDEQSCYCRKGTGCQTAKAVKATEEKTEEAAK